VVMHEHRLPACLPRGEQIECWKQLTGLHMLVNGGSGCKYGSAESGLTMRDRAAMYTRWGLREVLSSVILEACKSLHGRRHGVLIALDDCTLDGRQATPNENPRLVSQTMVTSISFP
jgi:hypothetical protein